MTQRRIMLASQMDDEEDRKVDSDGSTDEEGEAEDNGRMRAMLKFVIWKLF